MLSVLDEPLERARVSFQGLAVGDAFGETLFGAPDQVARRIAKRLISTRRPWRWTDDTAMALSIVEILEHNTTIDPDTLATAFTRRWASDPDRGYGHGAVAVAIAASLAATAIERENLIPSVMGFVPEGHVSNRLRRAAELDLKSDPVDVAHELGTGLDVAAHDTVAFCLWVVARHIDSYEDAVWTATSQDGDRDTLGAIVGSIVVLAAGVEAIPILWRVATEPFPASFGP